jgi:nucleotidyltransferase substrate binding protein (TIGR01987 family)
MSGAAETPDVRWKQRLHSFQTALAQLRGAVNLARQRELSELEQQGLVKAFEFTHEMAWNTLKDYLEDQGETGIHGSKDATRKAFRFGLIEDGEVWMGMIQSRNRSVHIYNGEMAAEITRLVIQDYFPAFEKFGSMLQSLEKESE